MKRFLLLVGIALAMFALTVGCGKKADEAQDKVPVETKAAEMMDSTRMDSGMNEMMDSAAHMADSVKKAVGGK